MKACVKQITKLPISLKRTGLYPKASLIDCWSRDLSDSCSLVTDGPMTWSKHDLHWQGWVSSLESVRSSAQHLSGWAVTAPSSSHPVSASRLPCLWVSLCCLGGCWLHAMFHLSISCWSECPADFSGPASADGSSDLLTILYHKYIQPHSPRLRKTKSRSSNSKFQLLVLKAVFILFLQWPSSS